MNPNGVNRRGQGVPEEQMLLTERPINAANIVKPTPNGKLCEKQSFLTPEPVRLTPAWEAGNLPNDELNLKGITMEEAQLECSQPKDKYNIVYLILLLHGIGTLLPWNMFITAKSYFVDYKLSKNYTGVDSDYAASFLTYHGFAAQGPNLLFNWLNIFIQIGGNLTTRIVWSIVVEMVTFVITVILAMTDSSTWPGTFFWLTMLLVIILNMANGIYQNTVYGMAAKLPSSYTGAIILGANISGTFTSIISIVSVAIAPNPKTAAMYYFITALFVLSLCFDTYFALPLNRFYKYNELKSQREAQKRLKDKTRDPKSIPYWEIFISCFPQCLNVFITFFTTLAIFPAIHSDVKRSDPSFVVSETYYVHIMCFLTFNVAAMVGSSLPAFGSWPKPKYLWIPITLRLLFIPLFLLCNYQPLGMQRVLPVYIDNDWAFWVIGAAMGVTSGYFSSVAMMYCPGTVSKEYASIASMFGAACIITGICAGLATNMVMPWIVANLRLPAI